MALKLFLVTIVFTSFFLMNLNEVEIAKEKNETIFPTVSFFDAILYDVDTEKVNKIIQASKFLQYEDKEELYFTNLILRNANNNLDTIIAQYIEKRGDVYSLRKNIILKRDNELELRTDTLKYNALTQIATNDSDFILRIKNSFWSGNHLYLNQKDMAIGGNNVHFKIKKGDLKSE